MVILNDKKQALNLLSQGKVLVLPSESSYGLSCLANNQEAVDRIFAIKKRSKNKSLLVVVANVGGAKKYLVWNESLDTIAKKYWPGALTIVAKAKVELANGVVDKNGALALRVTNYPILKYLSSRLKAPLVSTSANISGQKGIYNVDEVVRVFGRKREKPDVVFDCGRLPICRPTTVVSVVSGKVEILRQGELYVQLSYL